MANNFNRVIIDTGPLVAFLNRRDRYHHWVLSQIANMLTPLYTCEAVVSEACFLLRHFPNGPSNLLALFERRLIQIDFSLIDELPAVKRLVKKYDNIPMSFADACLVRMLETTPNSTIFTLDQDFKIYRMHNNQVIPAILPSHSF